MHKLSTVQPPLNVPSPLVLIAEDEPEIAEILVAYLAREGMKSVCALDGEQALEIHQTLKPDLVLLDVQMPKADGWQVLAEVRRRGTTPIIMVTAHDQDIDKLMALRIGADDYVVKPFNPAEVAARAQAVLRRTGQQRNDNDNTILKIGRLSIDLEMFQASVTIEDGSSKQLTLTLTEYRLLAHLAKTPRRVHSRAELLNACLPEGDTLERTVDSHISKLRKKLDDAGIKELLTSLRGIGYRLSGHDE
ncbi:response regulator transcription factor [Pantoea sp. Tr-811]|uniref:response regulator n=1 Tax=Pantoea sp. Tr-811 TaxID=2608361 RepID=UPI001424A70E|nr:response regulator [Pantoea sp. Tr-811]NIF29486.1 response regulator transcription factor [Pantoea sp. Tr-811]